MKHNQKNQVESDSVPIPAHLCKFKSEYDSEYTRKRSQNTQHTHTEHTWPPGPTWTQGEKGCAG